jgi:hypothetical protein
LTSVTFAAQLALPAEVTAFGLLPLCLFESMAGSSSAQLQEGVTVRRGGTLVFAQQRLELCRWAEQSLPDPDGGDIARPDAGIGRRSADA